MCGEQSLNSGTLVHLSSFAVVQGTGKFMQELEGFILA